MPMNNEDGWKHCPHCLGLNIPVGPGEAFLINFEKEDNGEYKYIDMMPLPDKNGETVLIPGKEGFSIELDDKGRYRYVPNKK